MGYSSECLLLSDKLILSPICNINKNQSISNQRFYIKKLETIKSSKINIKSKMDNFLPMNPSILQLDECYLINCRMVNYELNQQGLYHVKHPQRTIITENIIIKTDKNFNIISEHIITDKSNIVKLSNPNIEGYEDLILFKNRKGDICFTCTTLTTNSIGRPQITLCKLNDKFEIIEKMSIESPGGRAEKNWLPFVKGNSIFSERDINIIYEYNPFTIKSISFKSPKTSDILRKNYNLNLSRFKGSAAPIEFNEGTEYEGTEYEGTEYEGTEHDGTEYEGTEHEETKTGYLIIIHETFNLTNSLRCYLHRFVYLNEEMEIKKMSHPWFFNHHGIEFCRSMCHSYTPGNLILTYSIHDKDASWCEISIDYVKSLLKDLKYFMF